MMVNVDDDAPDRSHENDGENDGDTLDVLSCSSVLLGAMESKSWRAVCDWLILPNPFPCSVRRTGISDSKICIFLSAKLQIECFVFVELCACTDTGASKKDPITQTMHTNENDKKPNKKWTTTKTASATATNEEKNKHNKKERNAVDDSGTLTVPHHREQ